MPDTLTYSLHLTDGRELKCESIRGDILGGGEPDGRLISLISSLEICLDAGAMRVRLSSGELAVVPTRSIAYVIVQQ